MAKPKPDSVPAFYTGYIQLIEEDDLLAALDNNSQKAKTFFESIPDDKWDYRYAEGKWSIKEMLQHLIDTERIFCYRALRFARRDSTPLPGFAENHYAAHSKADGRSKQSLIEELKAVRTATELLFASFDEDQLALKGSANNNEISVLAIGFIIAGHASHHMKVLKERYLAH